MYLEETGDALLPLRSRIYFPRSSLARCYRFVFISTSLPRFYQRKLNSFCKNRFSPFADNIRCNFLPAGHRYPDHDNNPLRSSSALASRLHFTLCTPLSVVCNLLSIQSVFTTPVVTITSNGVSGTRDEKLFRLLLRLWFLYRGINGELVFVMRFLRVLN